jgi:hypothetical protein
MTTISSPGLSPSGPKRQGFPNLARREKTPEVIAEINAITDQELRDAGIRPCDFDMPMSSLGEVPSSRPGFYGMWSFERAWYYWIAKGPGIPPDAAEQLHAQYGREVRVDGHCCCPSPREWFRGFGCGIYHVDTPRGLKALVDTLRSINDPETDPGATPRTGRPR